MVDVPISVTTWREVMNVFVEVDTVVEPQITEFVLISMNVLEMMAMDLAVTTAQIQMGRFSVHVSRVSIYWLTKSHVRTSMNVMMLMVDVVRNVSIHQEAIIADVLMDLKGKTHTLMFVSTLMNAVRIYMNARKEMMRFVTIRMVIIRVYVPEDSKSTRTITVVMPMSV